MKCLYNGKLIIDSKILEGKAVVFNETIKEIIDEEEIGSRNDLEKIDVQGKYISPGFIDIHIHGFGGYDTMGADKEELKAISKGIAANGVTSFLPTTVTMDMKDIQNAFRTIRQVREEGTEGAQIIGAHMEGPFIHPQYKGAQNENYIIPPNYDCIKEFTDVISLITLASEIEGVEDFIKQVRENTDIVLSMGHTNATFEEAIQGIEAGITHITHFFNAMTGLHHRKPGVVGAGLASPVTCEIIADTFHIHPGLYEFLLKAKGMDKIILVTDCMCAGGMEEGEYDLGGQKVMVKEGQAKLEDGTLAGSVLRLNKAIGNVYEYTKYSLWELMQLVSYNPAKLLGIEEYKGSIGIGKDADITVFDGKMDIYLTIGRGRILYEK